MTIQTSVQTSASESGSPEMSALHWPLQTVPSEETLAAIAAGDGIPVLDVGPYFADEPGSLDQLAADLRAIQENVGFYCIVNHGVGIDVIEAATEQTRQLFALPEDIKQQSRAVYHHQGWWPPKSIVVNWSKLEHKHKQATVEGWIFFRERETDDPKVLANVRHRALNKWPDAAALPDFHSTMLRYVSEMEKAARKMVRVYARALELPATYFDDYFETPEFYQRCNYYEPGDPNVESIGMGAHTDHSFLTLLPTSAVPGLQVLTPAQNWLAVQHTPEAIIVNTGEFLNRWSNGRFMATPHRVTATKEDRITIPFFFNPGDDTLAYPVPTTIAPGEAPLFEPMTFGDFFEAYLAGNFQNRGELKDLEKSPANAA